MGLAGPSDIGLLGWCILTIDGDQSLVNDDQSVVKLKKVGESGASASIAGMANPVPSTCHSKLKFCSTSAGSNEQPPAG